ncbi:hypothetical protein N7509_006944 [Penicillium cosmopolitanum]|uniref:Uncharacterized protein n=1 Tax=Penicillium cosmopolitanum TaxID=1131564 RepID=A0A9W9VY32_9EURO|nr:uncharacterized protein N7509_006944 [Penicillium cosmopolitanum]KAJ5391454.1 hypothetical protein N7509_006944 [Penicillium cosmopolitanum]
MTITKQPGEDKYVNEEWVNHERRTMIQPDGWGSTGAKIRQAIYLEDAQNREINQSVKGKTKDCQHPTAV